MKKVLVLPVRNEEWIIARSIAAASLWADYIIIADQHSTDGTREILARYPKVRVIENDATYHSSTVRKMLLDEARKITGEKVIFSFDADEVPSAEILSDQFWGVVARLTPGTAIEFLWVNLWRSPSQYRAGLGVGTPEWKVFGFVDDGVSEFTNVNVINDHTSRIPLSVQTVQRFEHPLVLHYQFVIWARMLHKQAHYRVTEFLQKQQTFLTALKINIKYFSTKDERSLRTVAVPSHWTAAYAERGIDLQNISGQGTSWHENAVLDYFRAHGARAFWWLDIWDIDWVAQSRMLGRSFDVIALPPRWMGMLMRTCVLFCTYKNWLLRVRHSIKKRV